MKQFLIVIGIVGAITAGIVIFVLKDSAADSRRQSEEAPVIGFVATPVRWWDGDENQEGHTLTFSFVDNNNGVHAQTMEEITWYDSQKNYKVCYNPQDPDDWKLYASDHVCGS
ncbi:MAG TPA: hypothetical protein VHG93_26325 [Longimicrobium sp.]|nr:hypothetical protein [Longimicrobium sp.]